MITYIYLGLYVSIVCKTEVKNVVSTQNIRSCTAKLTYTESVLQ